MTYELSASLSKVITRSREEANRLGLSVIDIYSLALGLLSDPDGRACRLLVAQGIEPSDLRKRIDEQHRTTQTSHRTLAQLSALPRPTTSSRPKANACCA